TFKLWDGELNDVGVTTAAGFDYKLIVDHLAASTEFYLGRGSFWGSADAQFDDIIVYNRALTADEVQALRQIENRVYDFSQVGTGIDTPPYDGERVTDDNVYDLQGRRITDPSALQKGNIYIIRGRKVIVR
ncbi:LamG domain-containing protein, partial [Bacteroidales bacterium OttesenSCG-928-L03]|nr:LamG domain-containing protein [Bacteroidales bacterium OttesenSCG-928-L03]